MKYEMTINSNNSEYITCFSNHLVFVSNWVEMIPKTVSEPRSWPSLVFIRYSRVHAVAPPVAGQTSDFVNKILDNTGRGDPTGGLVGLRVPTSKM